MYKVGVDCHIHTMWSGHAYCTVRDNVMEAMEQGLEGIGIADHFGPQFIVGNPQSMEDSFQLFAQIGHFFNFSSIPEIWHGVRIFRSVEIDITDARGTLFAQDIPDWSRRDRSLAEALFAGTDYAIASVHHVENAGAISSSQGTVMYCNALENPKIKILGHIGRALIPFDIDTVLKRAKELGKIIEINEHSFDYSQQVKQSCRAIAMRCAELGVWITVNSDAHCSAQLGQYGKSFAMLEEIGFPNELIANESLERFTQVMGL